MISCTEFIPAYSELFSYLDKTYGRGEVDVFWEYLFAPTGTGIPLINYVMKEGIAGCYHYWEGPLNEEAADFTMYLNEKAGWFLLRMHHCPSKGRLLQLKEEIGITPYPHYCMHCDSYRSAVEKVGLRYLFDATTTDHAACQIFIYDPKVFKGKAVVDDETLILDRRATENEYFHPDFHSSMNMGIHYLGDRYGIDAVREYLVRYTENVYAPLIAQLPEKRLKVIADKIADTYEKEHATDALTLSWQGDALCVSVAYCPAVRHLKATGREVSPFYRYTTETVMQTLAEKAGVPFTMLSYDETTGAASYRFG